MKWVGVFKCDGEEGKKEYKENEMDITYSVNGVPLRLIYERWYHIIESEKSKSQYKEKGIVFHRFQISQLY